MAYIIEKKYYYNNHINLINYQINATATIILALQLAREYGLEINIEMMGIQIQYGGGTDDS